MKRNSVLFIHATERDVFMIVEGGQSEGAYFEVPVILMYAVANAGEGVGHKTRGIEIGLAGWLRHCTHTGLTYPSFAYPHSARLFRNGRRRSATPRQR